MEGDRLISIHTPARGVTTAGCPGNGADFNPHSRTGSDIDSLKIIPFSVISIHTPARGVTVKRPLLSSRRQISIHTPARGVTLRDVSQASYPLDFNPHSRTGSDHFIALINSLYNKISIHTPARGVTSQFFYVKVQIQISIHTPARGVTNAKCIPLPGIAISIHTPARGVTQQIAFQRYLSHKFQSTLPHGE